MDDKHLIKQLSAGLGCALIFALATDAHAQDASTAAKPHPLWDNISASVSVIEQYNDNIFYARNPPIPVTQTTKSDFITIVTPSMSFNVDNKKLDFTLGGSAEIGRYARNPSEDYEDFRVYGDAIYRISPGFLFFGGASYRQDHEDRGSPDDVNGIEPTIFTVGRFAGAFLKKFDKANIKVGATYDHYNFDDVAAGPGAPVNPINNDDRDRGHLEAGVRAGYMLSPRNEVFGEFTYDRRDYRQGVDDLGFNRDSDGIRIAGGIRHRVARTLDALCAASA